MQKNISLIDFGAGNLHSVYKAFKFIGANIEITKDESVIEKSDAVVFPGVGAFGSVMKSVRENNLENIIKKTAKSDKSFLGICVGMQVLFDLGEENPDTPGLGVFKGSVVKFKKAKKIPHIGWNDVENVIARRDEIPTWQSHSESKFYFVHSYYVIPDDKNLIYSETEYDGEKFTSVIKRNNLLAVQFHPEKSGDAGLDFLTNFVKSI